MEKSGGSKEGKMELSFFVCRVMLFGCYLKKKKKKNRGSMQHYVYLMNTFLKKTHKTLKFTKRYFLKESDEGFTTDDK